MVMALIFLRHAYSRHLLKSKSQARRGTLVLGKRFVSMHDFFARFATTAANWCGHASAFAIALAIVLLWVVTGPIFDYSDTWQLVINTLTTVVTFLIVFLIQNSQNRDTLAIQAKLDELIRSGNGANRYIGIEELSEKDLEALRDKCRQRAQRDSAHDLGAAE
jgi:low affinity Fe/Cu permease